jgi:hypothetical protein
MVKRPKFQICFLSTSNNILNSLNKFCFSSGWRHLARFITCTYCYLCRFFCCIFLKIYIRTSFMGRFAHSRIFHSYGNVSMADEGLKWITCTKKFITFQHLRPLGSGASCDTNGNKMDPNGNKPVGFLGLSKTEGNITCNICKLILYQPNYILNLMLLICITVCFY